MKRLVARLLAPGWAAVALAVFAGCDPKNATEAESRKDIAWLANNPTGESVAALGRLADSDPRALTALQARAQDVNVYIAAWGAVTRNVEWGTKLLKDSLADPTRSELAASALPRRDARLVPFIGDLEGAVLRMASGSQGGVIAGVLASIGQPAHAAVEHRLVDGKTRGAMCDAIRLPEASGDAKSVLLAVPADARDNPACVSAVVDLATTDDVVLDWLATRAEPGLLGGAASGALPCPRLGVVWQRALEQRPPETDAALTVPLRRLLVRCASQLDPVLASLLAKNPRSRAAIVNAIDPFGIELSSMKETCGALKSGIANSEGPLVRSRVDDALGRGCKFAK